MARIKNAEAEERLARCLTYLSQGMGVREISEREGLKRVTLHRFLFRHGAIKTGSKDRARRIQAAADNWGKERLDPSNLTREQLDHASRVGITPGRYAWLLTCPKGGNAHGWKGGASIG
jgi:hypothetical protein